MPLHLPKPSKLPDSDARFDTAARIVRSAASRARWLIRGSVALPLCYMLMLFLDFEERMLSGVRFWVCAVVGFFLLAWLIAGLLSDWPFRWLPAWSDRVASASRRLGRCPSCFADLAGVGADAATGRTTCPQCAAEWKLPTIVRCRSCGFSLAYAKPGGTGPLKCDACGTWNDRAHAKLPQRCPRCLYTLDAATLRIDGSLTCSECGLVVVEGIPVRLHDAQPGVEPGRWFCAGCARDLQLIPPTPVRRCICRRCRAEFMAIEELADESLAEQRCPLCTERSGEALELVHVRRCPDCQIINATNRHAATDRHDEQCRNEERPDRLPR